MFNVCVLTVECYILRKIFSIGTAAAYSAKYSALVAFKILKLFKY